MAAELASARAQVVTSRLVPEAATRPCALAVLPAGTTVADLEAAYVLRGSQIVACDGARRLAVETRGQIDLYDLGDGRRVQRAVTLDRCRERIEALEVVRGTADR